jgi:hypothetical protein
MINPASWSAELLMEPAVSENPQAPLHPLRGYGKLLLLINTTMNVLGWGCLASVISHLWFSVLGSIAVLLIFLVPGSLFANLCITLWALYDGIKHYGSLQAFLKHLPWKNKWFILGCINTLLYLIGCALFIYLVAQPIWVDDPSFD